MSQTGKSKRNQRESNLAEKYQTGGPFTTVMIRNIPTEYRQDELILEVTKVMGSPQCFDFFYLPWDTQNDCNMGYVFVNFPDPGAAQTAVRAFSNYNFRLHDSKKVGKVSPAHIQGLENNLRHLQDRAVVLGNHPCSPVVMWKGQKVELSLIFQELRTQDTLRKFGNGSGGSGSTSSHSSPGRRPASQASQAGQASHGPVSQSDLAQAAADALKTPVPQNTMAAHIGQDLAWMGLAADPNSYLMANRAAAMCRTAGYLPPDEDFFGGDEDGSVSGYERMAGCQGVVAPHSWSGSPSAPPGLAPPPLTLQHDGGSNKGRNMLSPASSASGMHVLRPGLQSAPTTPTVTGCTNSSNSWSFEHLAAAGQESPVGLSNLPQHMGVKEITMKSADQNLLDKFMAKFGTPN